MIWANDAFILKTEGPLEIIGDNVVALIGGCRAVWLKTEGQKEGKAYLKITSPRFGEQKLEFNLLINKKT